MGEAKSVPELHGRMRELSALTDIYRSACAGGSAAAVLVSGDAGVGKTRLINELVQLARPDATILVGNAVDIADAPPFWPVLSAVRAVARTNPEDDVTILLRQWLAQLPLMDGGDGPDTKPPVRLLDLLHQLIVDLAELRPVVLVIEDLQWADRSTRDLIAYLVANLTDEPVLVLATNRSDSPGRTSDLAVALAELRRHQKVLAVELDPLPRNVLAELVARWAPERPDLEWLVWQRSEGNVFIAEETVRAVLAGDLQGLPNTLREIVLSRMSLLSPPAQQVVRAVATGVVPPRHRVLADVLDLGPDDLLAAIREAVANGIVLIDRNGDGYQLRHGLMTEVVVADLLPGERIDLHRRYALALSRAREAMHPGLAAQLAHHWYEADDPEQALVATVAAARASASIHAHSEAHQHWLRAAELMQRVSGDLVGLDRGGCVERAARAAELAGDYEQAVRLLEQLLADPDIPEGLPSALLTARRGSALAAAGRAGDSQRSYRAAAALLPTVGAEAERAQVLAGYSAALLHALDFAGARTVALQALGLARQARARTVEARILAVLGFSLAYLENVTAGSAAIEESLLVAERTGEPEAIGEAHLRRAELLAGPLNRLVEGVERAREGLKRMQSLGLARTAGVALLTYAANAHFRLGQWDEADRAVAEAWALRPTGAAALDVRLARSRLELGRGQLEAAAADLEAVDLLARSTAGPRQRIPQLVLFAALELWRRRPAAALRYIDDGLAVAAEAGADDIWSVAPLVWHGTRAWADLVTTGRPAPTAMQLDRIRYYSAELARQGANTVPAVRAVIEAFDLMCAAETARAERHTDPAVWERVAELWEAHDQPYPAAYARMRHAEALLSGQPRGSATDVLRRAEQAARRLGARPLLDDIVDLAVRARVSLETPERSIPEPPARKSPLDQLTARELEVLGEVAKGLTNREIGNRLYISEKTVGVHMTRIFHKIGVHSRVQASAVLHRSRPAPERR